MDCFTDMMCRAVLPRLQAEPRLLELTKVADVDPALARELPDAAFADRGRRELPVHTAAHTALSRLYLDHNPGLPTEVVEEVKQACAAFGLPEELFAPRAPKVASAPDPADFLFPEERRVRVATAEEVSRAARKLSDEGMRLVAGERVAAARRLRAKAAALGVQLPDAVLRMAGDADTDCQLLVEQLEARATMAKDAALGAKYQALADAVRTERPDASQQAKIAAILERLDAEAVFPRRHGMLDPAAAVYSGRTRKAASAMDLDLGAGRLTGGAAAQLPPELLGDVLGPDVMRDVAPSGQVDPQLLQQVVSTLPRDVKQQLAQQLRAAGVALDA
jgi:hypothetical protein